MDKTIEVVVRYYQPPMDDNYILSTWSRYCWYSPTEKRSRSTNKPDWFRVKTDEIKRLLAKSMLLSDVFIRVACFKTDPSIILGYIVIKDGKQEWLCVKKPFWGQGIEQLLKKSTCTNKHAFI